MRQGTLLVEDNPSDLLKKYLCSSIEEVFLKVCHQQENIKGDSDNDSNNNDSNRQYDEESSALIVRNNTINQLEEVKTNGFSNGKLGQNCQIFEMTNTKYEHHQHNSMDKFHEFLVDNYNKTKSQVKKSVVKTQRNIGKLCKFLST